MKKIWIITLFPEYFEPFIKHGVVGQMFSHQQENNGIELKLISLRDFSLNNYKSVDDTPYGGGPGMVMKADVLSNALLNGVIESGGYNLTCLKDQLTVIYPSPRGKIWNSDVAKDFAKNTISSDKDLVFICGRYEGIDERFIEKYVDEFYSIGEFILSGGEIAVLTILDSAMRYVEGTLGNHASLQVESYEDDLLEYPQFTRPRIFESTDIPEILLSGHHEKIEKQRKLWRIEMTQKYRPDLYQKYLSKNQR